MQCNIDARGKAVRLITGSIVLLVGLIGLGLTWMNLLPDLHGATWAVGGLLVVIGGFMIFEGRSGWCVVRAMGGKTPI